MLQTLEIIVLISSCSPQVTEEVGDSQMRRLAAIILKMYTRAETKAWSSSLGVVKRANSLTPYE
jgi:hypothetical protein